MAQRATRKRPIRELTEEEREARRQEQIRRNQAALEWLAQMDQATPEEIEEQRRDWDAIERTLRDYPIQI
jgi:hypothetical protein